MAKNVYLKPSSAKPLLLHRDTLVRRNVAAYFRESLSQDKELIFLVVEDCHKYGEAENSAGLEAARHFRQSYPIGECFMSSTYWANGGFEVL